MAFNGVVTADRAVAPSNGLFSVAKVVNHGARDEHWIGGFYVETDSCTINTDLLPLCDASNTTPVNLYDMTEEPFFHVSAFGIIEKFECENSIGYNAVDRRATVVSQLKRVTENAVSAELWNGVMAQRDTDAFAGDRYLTASNVVAGTFKPKVAVGVVETAFSNANPGLQATIHVTPLIADALDLEERDGKLYTQSGALVAIHRGVTGQQGPVAGGSVTTHWVYATGPVHVDLGGEELITVSASEIVNSVTNKVTYVAERPAAVYFDGCAAYGTLADATL